MDDVKTLKGRDNWIRARHINDKLFIGSEADNRRTRIDDQETFYTTDFAPHLSIISNHKCNCLTCGFCDEGMFSFLTINRLSRDYPSNNVPSHLALDNITDISCSSRNSHQSSCIRCAEGFAIFNELNAAIEAKGEVAKGLQANPLELQQLDQLKCDVQGCIDDLIEYRGHLARHTSEEDEAIQELENLADDEAVVTSDYKMKILACFFRENQKKWFGKRGSPTLGFMIVTNPKDIEAKAKGVKDVTFVMMVTNDGTQDDWAVACGKAYIYQNHLPDYIKKVIFIADGAGCFKSKLHRAIQGFWKVWTGIEEKKYRLTPAGDGKTCLDGMFGRMSTILSTSVDAGASYYNMETVFGFRCCQCVKWCFFDSIHWLQTRPELSVFC